MVIRLKTLSKIIICLIFLGCIVLLVKGGFDWYQKTAYPREYSQYVEKYAREYQVDEDLIYAVIKTESGFDPKAVSVNDAKGLMQITKDTFDWISGKLGYKDKQHDDLFDPETGIEYGTFFLSYLLNEFQEPCGQRDHQQVAAGSRIFAGWKGTGKDPVPGHCALCKKSHEAL